MAKTTTLFAVTVTALFGASPSDARSLLLWPSCGKDFMSSASAAVLPDARVLWNLRHYFDCNSRAVWVSFTNPAPNFNFRIDVSVPALGYLSNVRARALIVGPGLPAFPTTDMSKVPPEVLADPVLLGGFGGAGFTGVLMNSGSEAELATCGHVGPTMAKTAEPVDGRCHRHMHLGQGVAPEQEWPLIDREIQLPQAGGTYRVAVWIPGNSSGKVDIELGTWAEDFVTAYTPVEPACRRSIPDWFETERSRAACFPVLTCPAAIDNPYICAQSTCGATSCQNRLARHPLCLSEGRCSCDTLSCNSEFRGPQGAVSVASVCPATCGMCGTTRYTPKMGCGGAMCPDSVKRWDAVKWQMHSGKAIQLTCDANVDFVRGMIPHQAGAIAMCDLLLKELTCAENDATIDGLVRFCYQVRNQQDTEITKMRSWLAQRSYAETTAACSETATSRPPQAAESVSGASTTMPGGGVQTMPAMSSTPQACGNLNCPSSELYMKVNRLMLQGMSIRFACNPGVDFAREMIPLRAAAVLMCDALFNSARPDPVLQELCSNITRTQLAEITFLSEWLAARGQDITASCSACAGAVQQPPKPCEDTLPASSFCRELRTDRFCDCTAANDFAARIGDSICKSHDDDAVPSFARINYGAECKRTCGKCGARQPVLPDPCANEQWLIGWAGARRKDIAANGAPAGAPAVCLVAMAAAAAATLRTVDASV